MHGVCFFLSWLFSQGLTLSFSLFSSLTSRFRARFFYLCSSPHLSLSLTDLQPPQDLSLCSLTHSLNRTTHGFYFCVFVFSFATFLACPFLTSLSHTHFEIYININTYFYPIILSVRDRQARLGHGNAPLAVAFLLSMVMDFSLFNFLPSYPPSLLQSSC